MPFSLRRLKYFWVKTEWATTITWIGHVWIRPARRGQWRLKKRCMMKTEKRWTWIYVHWWYPNDARQKFTDNDRDRVEKCTFIGYHQGSHVSQSRNSSTVISTEYSIRDYATHMRGPVNIVISECSDMRLERLVHASCKLRFKLILLHLFKETHQTLLTTP